LNRPTDIYSQSAQKFNNMGSVSQSVSQAINCLLKSCSADARLRNAKLKRDT